MEKTLERLKVTADISNEILLYHHGYKLLNKAQEFCLCIIDKLNLSSNSLLTLCKGIEKSSRLEYGCGIIIRSVLLDFAIPTIQSMTILVKCIMICTEKELVNR